MKKEGSQKAHHLPSVPPHLPSLRLPFHTDHLPLVPRTAGLYGRLAKKSPLTRHREDQQYRGFICTRVCESG